MKNTLNQPYRRLDCDKRGAGAAAGRTAIAIARESKSGTRFRARAASKISSPPRTPTLDRLGTDAYLTLVPEDPVP